MMNMASLEVLQLIRLELRRWEIADVGGEDYQYRTGRRNRPCLVEHLAAGSRCACRSGERERRHPQRTSAWTIGASASPLPGVTQGFAMADLPVYDRDAAERHCERTLDLWRRSLPAPQTVSR
jgi:hypothetical protein